MMLLVTGASGAGKSTAKRLAAPRLAPKIECAELADIVVIPAQADIRWRQRSTEQAVRRALELQKTGRHLMLASDPVAIGEVLAAPSAIDLDGIAACLLDTSPEAQSARLNQRGDDPSLLRNHIAFAEWMRGHARDPQHRQFVIMDDGWEQMRWQRWSHWAIGDSRWRFAEIDTSCLSPDQTAERVIEWAQGAIEGDSGPVLRGRWWER